MRVARVAGSAYSSEIAARVRLDSSGIQRCAEALGFRVHRSLGSFRKPSGLQLASLEFSAKRSSLRVTKPFLQRTEA